MNTTTNSGNAPQHAEWCDLIEARYVPWWAQSSYMYCNCGAEDPMDLEREEGIE